MKRLSILLVVLVSGALLLMACSDQERIDRAVQMTVEAQKPAEPTKIVLPTATSAPEQATATPTSVPVATKQANPETAAAQVKLSEKIVGIWVSEAKDFWIVFGEDGVLWLMGQPASYTIKDELSIAMTPMRDEIAQGGGIQIFNSEGEKSNLLTTAIQAQVIDENTILIQIDDEEVRTLFSSDILVMHRHPEIGHIWEQLLGAWYSAEYDSEIEFFANQVVSDGLMDSFSIMHNMVFIGSYSPMLIVSINDQEFEAISEESEVVYFKKSPQLSKFAEYELTIQDYYDATKKVPNDQIERFQEQLIGARISGTGKVLSVQSDNELDTMISMQFADITIYLDDVAPHILKKLKAGGSISISGKISRFEDSPIANNTSVHLTEVFVIAFNDSADEQESGATYLPPKETPLAQSVGEQPDGRIFETNGLPPSQNALPLELGQRVRSSSGIQGITVRTLPGAAAGDVVGYMEPPTTATIINGPVWLPGNSDTIVWWFIRTDAGVEAWVPANTSEFTLLEPVP